MNDMNKIIRNKADLIDCININASYFNLYDINTISLFGSFQRGDQTDNSDIDLIVDFKPGKKNYRNFFNAYELLEKITNRKIELLTKSSLKPYMRDKILKESEYVFINK
jgi:predicted nucleotidyltransferase